MQLDDNATFWTSALFEGIIRKFDFTRPVSGAWNDFGGPEARSFEWSKGTDIMGYNYRMQIYDDFHQANPTKPLISSESCSCVSDRAPYANSTQDLLGALTAWDCIKNCWTPVSDRDWVIGSFAWTFFDYRGLNLPNLTNPTNPYNISLPDQPDY